ncbi:MAG TPA: tyrosine-type recombinase/integrase [Polyangiaceae bacterium]|jgi:hypothetical protein
MNMKKHGPAHTGSPLKTRDGFSILLRYGSGQRSRFTIKLMDERAAEKRARALRELAGELCRLNRPAEAKIILTRAAEVQNEQDFEKVKSVAAELMGEKDTAKLKVVTFTEMRARWTGGDLARTYPDHVKAKATSELDAARCSTMEAVQIAPGLNFGELPIDRVTIDHCEKVMSNLPESAKRPATRRQYAQLIHRVMAIAVYPCRLIAANPLPKGFMPKVGKPPAYPFLYPEEDRALLRCEKVPLPYRVLYGFLAREGTRVSEATGLDFKDLDLEIGAVSLDRNKTNDPRTWALDPGVSRALRLWRGLAKNDGSLRMSRQRTLPGSRRRSAGT